MDICPKCGLPKQACVCEEIAKSEQRIQLATTKKKFGKVVTLVSGIEKGIDIKKIAKDLKAELGCGGTVRENVIELQGDHIRKIKPILVRLGFSESSISS
ncbi:MAG TPA: stress response translation initiation inhibitor YciH [Candidatus Nanoarchaeia archaeon]|nr:stress response translation initiation inhibitor YciH [Candidatus Nanoarchaeia archaeon]